MMFLELMNNLFLQRLMNKKIFSMISSPIEIIPRKSFLHYEIPPQKQSGTAHAMPFHATVWVSSKGNSWYKPAGESYIIL